MVHKVFNGNHAYNLIPFHNRQGNNIPFPQPFGHKLDILMGIGLDHLLGHYPLYRAGLVMARID